MSDTNPQVTPVQGTDNAQGISIDNLLGVQGNPVPEGMGPVNDTPQPPVSESTNLTPQPNQPITDPASVDPTPQSDQDQDELYNILLSADNLSPEDAQLRTNIFSKFGATNIDAQGNLLDKNNRVILSKANLDNYILNDELLLDSQGNHVNEQGEIITPAQEVSSTNTFVNTARSEVEKQFGFRFLDAEGKPKHYANTAEGNTELLTDAINNAHTSAVRDFLNANEEVKRIFFHLNTGGTLDNYVNDTFDYSQVDVSNLTREQKLNYIKTSFEKQGLQNAESTLKLIEGASDEALNSSTADALLALNKITATARDQKEQEYLEQAEQQRKANEEYWTGVKGRIDQGKIKNISIPTNEKDKFFNYIATAVDNQGRSQEMIDMDNEDPDFGLMVSYLRYKKLDLDALIKIRAKDNRLSNARERFNIIQPPSITNNPAPSTRSGDIISLESLQ